MDALGWLRKHLDEDGGNDMVRELAVEAVRSRGSRPDIWDQGFAVTARSISERTAEALYREGMGLAHRTQDV